jgi:Kef-type K+ transport system membrane component KefB
VLTRGAAKILGVSLANWGSGTSWRQAIWTGCAMSPMSSVALLMVSQLSAVSALLGAEVAAIALPAILLMEVLGAIIVTFALDRARETSRADAAEGAGRAGELRG